MGGGSGDDSSTNDIMRQKLENYASAFIETIADKRQRNVDWAKSAVVESKATTAEKALQLKVIDLIAADMPDLLRQLNGRAVDGKILKTAGAAIVPIPPILSERLFQMVWQPEVMMLL